MNKAPEVDLSGLCLYLRVRRLVVGRFAGELEELNRQMTIAVRVFVQIVLMVLIGGEEIAQRRNLRHDRLIVQLLFLIENAFDNRQLHLVRVIHASTVACTLIVPLTVEQRRVDSVEEHVDKES